MPTHPHGLRRPGTARIGRRGTVLIVTIWITLVLAGLVLVFARAMRVEAVAAANQVAARQAEAIARGALQYVLSNLDNSRGTPPTAATMPCEAVSVGDGYFWILKPDFESDSLRSFGLVDEASKLNLNTAPLEAIQKLPSMTDDVAACIKSWRDPSTVTTPGGAESNYYLLLPDPYNAKNSAFETIEELLLVEGVTPALLYGQDANRNGALDPGESELTNPAPGGDGNNLDMGIANYVTVYSVQPNTDANRRPLVNVNSANTGAFNSLLRRNLSSSRANAILAAAGNQRQGGAFQNLLDFYVRTGLTAAEFRTLAPSLTASGGGTLRGLVNVNTAPRAVLACLPGLDASDVETLAAKRAESGTDLKSIAWVADALPRAKAVAVGGAITALSYQYSADILAVSGNGRAFKRYRAVLDARQSPPAVRYWKELTYLGWPLGQDILATLRAGGALEPTLTVAGS